MYYPTDFESRIGFDRIRTELSRQTQSTVGATLVDQLTMSDHFDDLDYELRRTFEMRSCLMMEDEFPYSGYRDTRFAARARIEGNYLTADELVQLAKALEIAGTLRKFFVERENDPYPLLKALSQDVETFDVILRDIRRIVDDFGRIKDNASPELATIRREIQAKSGRVSSVLSRILRQAQEEGYADKESSVSIRDGRAVIPISAGYKRKINGFVHSESATGRTAFIEPVEVVELNNDVRELEMAEKREIVKILTIFTNNLRPNIEGVLAAGDYVGEIDFIAAKAKYALKIDATMPLFEKERIIELRDARHPLLEQNLKAEGRKIVPLNLRLDTKKHILLISGPNAGGKSVCLKTVGLLQYMLQCGLLVPVKENSQMSIFNNILLDIGDQQSLDNDLSTYSSHLLNMKNFLRLANAASLILIDEFGGGTEPTIGGAIAEAVLEQLRSRGTFGVITTHYANLKYYGTAAEGVDNGAMTFDVEHITPLFALEQGRSGSSFALEIARKIGLPETILATAREKIGVDQVTIEKQLREAARDKRYWETKREKIRLAEKGVERTVEQYEAELSTIKEKRTEILRKAREEAQNILSEANRQIENTIREIREVQAEKERTKAARESISVFREQLQTIDNESDDEIARKMAKLKERQARQAERRAQRTSEDGTKKEPPKARPKEIEVGMQVKMAGQSVVGRVVSITGNNAQVEFVSLTTRVDKRKLVAATADEIRKGEAQAKTATAVVNVAGTGFSTMQRRMDFKDTIDLRGMRGAEALDQVKLFVDDAIMLGVSQVRILHGKGTGALKQQIREYLSFEPAVASAADEHVDMGGAGITVVKFY